jgi:hypothetical protein
MMVAIASGRFGEQQCPVLGMGWAVSPFRLYAIECIIMRIDKAYIRQTGRCAVESPWLEQAVEVASRMLRLHESHAPAWTGSCEVRPVVTHSSREAVGTGRLVPEQHEK